MSESDSSQEFLNKSVQFLLESSDDDSLNTRRIRFLKTQQLLEQWIQRSKYGRRPNFSDRSKSKRRRLMEAAARGARATEAPKLKLIVEKGPREGETLERKPGLAIRIGRVVKGNNFTIKDVGISSKHLLIEFKDMKWVVYNLDASSGTFLNEVQVEGNEGFQLKNGDIIKIGGYTSIKVCIDEEERELEVKETKGFKKVVVSGNDDNVEGEKKELGRKRQGGGAAKEQVLESNCRGYNRGPSFC